MNNEKLLKFKKTISELKNEKLILDEKNKFSKAFFVPLYDELKKISSEQKKDFGSKINFLKFEFEKIIESRIQELKIESINNFEPDYDLFLNIDSIKTNISNPLQIIIEKINNFFLNLSFQIINGNEVVLEKYNFEHLNIKEDHPARDMHDSFYIDKNWLLRTHCTAITAELIENRKDNELKVISFGNVYRKDDDDSTHSHQFNQLDMVWLGKELSISNLKWLIDSLLKYIFDDSIKTRYRLSYFPFTEPSFEVDVSCFNCNSKGCNICKKTGWIEILGAGILHPNVIKDAKLNSDMVGLAAGIGIDRIAMLKFGIQDIRDIYNNNFRLLEQFRGKK